MPLQIIKSGYRESRKPATGSTSATTKELDVLGLILEDWVLQKDIFKYRYFGNSEINICHLRVQFDNMKYIHDKWHFYYNSINKVQSWLCVILLMLFLAWHIQGFKKCNHTDSCSNWCSIMLSGPLMLSDTPGLVASFINSVIVLYYPSPILKPPLPVPTSAHNFGFLFFQKSFPFMPLL